MLMLMLMLMQMLMLMLFMFMMLLLTLIMLMMLQVSAMNNINAMLAQATSSIRNNQNQPFIPGKRALTGLF